MKLCPAVTEKLFRGELADKIDKVCEPGIVKIKCNRIEFDPKKGVEVFSGDLLIATLQLQLEHSQVLILNNVDFRVAFTID